MIERIHQTIIDQHLSNHLVFNISRDSTAIIAREKPQRSRKKSPRKKERVEPIQPVKRGRPKKGEQRVKSKTRLELQSDGMSLVQMEAELPKACNVGTKRNSKGHTSSWIGYKLHSDASDDGIPVSCILSSVSLHDSQVAIPLALKTKQRVSISVKC